MRGVVCSLALLPNDATNRTPRNNKIGNGRGKAPASPLFPPGDGAKAAPEKRLGRREPVVVDAVAERGARKGLDRDARGREFRAGVTERGERHHVVRLAVDEEDRRVAFRGRRRHLSYQSTRERDD